MNTKYHGIYINITIEEKKNKQMILASYKRYSSMDQSTAESSKALTLKILFTFSWGKIAMSPFN